MIAPTLRPELLALLAALFLATPVASAQTDAKVAAIAALPTAKIAGATYVVDEGAIVITRTAAKKSVRLHPIAAAVFALADGKTSVSGIREAAQKASGYELDDAAVFGVLDALADADLLVARVSPPGGSSELDLLVMDDGTLGTALVTTVTPGKDAGEADFAKVKVSEQKLKAVQRDRIRKESALKAERPALKLAREELAKKKSELTAARTKESDAKSKKVSEAAVKTAEKDVAAKKVAAESTAKKSSKLRLDEKFSEQSAKK
jgi:hypothetical protein